MSDTSTNSVTTVPFSPIPGHVVDMKFRATDEWSYTATPLMELAKQGYRSVAIDVALGGGDYRLHQIRADAQTALDLETAYMDRARAEHHAAKAAEVRVA